MNTQMLVLVQLAVIGVLFVGVSIPIAMRKIPRNGWYGYRTAKTLSADEIWYPANAFAGKALAAAGVVMILFVLALAPFAGRLTPETLWIVFLYATLVPLIGATAASAVYVHSLPSPDAETKARGIAQTLEQKPSEVATLKMVLALPAALTGLLMISMAIPLIGRRVPINPTYGFRVLKTMASETVWYAANAYSGKALLAAGAVMVLGGGALALLAKRIPLPAVVVTALGLIVVPLAVALWMSFQYLATL